MEGVQRGLLELEIDSLKGTVLGSLEGPHRAPQSAQPQREGSWVMAESTEGDCYGTDNTLSSLDLLLFDAIRSIYKMVI